MFEVVWVVLLKQSDGFTRVGWGVATCAAMAVSFLAMSQALRSLPMGTVYAVWTGIGAAGGLAWGIAIEGEPAGIAADRLRVPDPSRRRRAEARWLSTGGRLAAALTLPTSAL